MYKKVLLSVLCSFLIFNSVSYKGFATDQSINDLRFGKYVDIREELIADSFINEEDLYSTNNILVDGDGSGTGSSSATPVQEFIDRITLDDANYSGKGTPLESKADNILSDVYNWLLNCIVPGEKYTYVFLCNNINSFHFVNTSLFDNNEVYISFRDNNNILLSYKSINSSTTIDVPKTAVLCFITVANFISNPKSISIDVSYSTLFKRKYYFNVDWMNMDYYVYPNKIGSISKGVYKYFMVELKSSKYVKFYNIEHGLKQLINAYQCDSSNKFESFLFQIPSNCNFIETSGSCYELIGLDDPSNTWRFKITDNLFTGAYSSIDYISSIDYGEFINDMINSDYYKNFGSNKSELLNVYFYFFDNNFKYTSGFDTRLPNPDFHNKFYGLDLNSYYNSISYYRMYQGGSNQYLGYKDFLLAHLKALDRYSVVYYSAYENYFDVSNGSPMKPDVDSGSGGGSSGGSSGGSTTVSSDLMDILKDIRNNVVNCYGTLDKIRNTYVANSKDLFDILKEMNSKLNNLGSGSTDLTNTNNLINQVLSKLDMLNTSIKNINLSVPSVDLSKIYDRLDILISKVQSLDNNNRADFKSLLKALEDLQINNNISNVTNKEGKSIWDFLTELIKGLSDVLTHLTDGLSDISTKLLDLVDKFMDMLISLIVPDDSFFNDYFQSIHDDFSSRTGLFTSPLNVATNVVDQFQQVNQSGEYVLTIPNVDLLGVRFINEQSYDVQEVFSSGEMSKLYNYYMIVIKGIFSLLFLNYLRKKFEHGILGGSNA